MTTITPGTNTPCMNRQKTSWCRVCEVAASRVGAVSAYSEGTITFLRPTDSASSPMKGAVSAIARMVALTVSETAISEALKTVCRYGSSGCVLYTFRNVHMPANMQATIATRGGAAASTLETELGAVTSISKERETRVADGRHRIRKRIVQLRIIGEVATGDCDAYNTTSVMPRLPLPRSLSLFSSGIRFRSSQLRSSLVRQFSP